jgi:CubicO group peptidase (beta-lactamase class C family)
VSGLDAEGPGAAALADALAAIDFAGVAVVAPEGGPQTVVAMGAADRSSGRPITPGTRFGIASSTKAITAVTLVSLMAEGLAEPSTQVVDVLPQGRRPRDLDPRVTLEHLLTHTSGMADYFDEHGQGHYEDIWRRHPGAAMLEPADMLTLFADLPRRAEPGVEVRYNNGAFVLLALVVEALAGTTFPDAVAARVFGPAGMTASGFPVLDEVDPGLAMGHLPPDDAHPWWRTNVLAIPARGGGDGGAICSAGDLVRFLDAFREGRLVPEAWREAMLEPRARDEREACWYGLGWCLRGEGAGRNVGHHGEDPGFSARMAWFPETGGRVVVLSNVTSGSRAAFRMIAGLPPD